MTDSAINRYHDDIDDWVANAIQRNPLSFAGLLELLPSIFPTDVITALNQLHMTRRIRARIFENLQSDIKKITPRQLASAYRQRVPHPLDYEWQFTEEAKNTITRRVDKPNSGNQNILLLGCPSLVKHISSLPGTKSTVLLDRNSEIIRSFEHCHSKILARGYDILRDPIDMSLMSDVVVVDPPWYLPHIKSFLWLAAHHVLVNGLILLSFPAKGTRPGILSERNEVENWARQLGLAVIDFDEGVLPYFTPPFEMNALRAAGIQNVPLSWRRGDLFVFSRIAATQITRPEAAPEDESWLEVAINGVRIRFRGSSDSTQDSPILIEIVPGDVLPSVSRRDARRQGVDVWTSGNRVYRCNNTWAARIIAEAIQTQVDPVYAIRKFGLASDSKVDEAAITAVEQQIKNIVRIERAEFGNNV